MGWPKGTRNRRLGRPPAAPLRPFPKEAFEPRPPPPRRIPFAEGDPFFRFRGAKPFYAGPCPRCQCRGVLYWRLRTEDYRCMYCEIEVGDDALAGRLEPARDAFQDGLWALRRARRLESSEDAEAAAAYRQKALEHFRRLAAILPRWKLGPVAGIRRGQERGG